MEHTHDFDEPSTSKPVRGTGGAGDHTNLTPGDMAPFTPELMARFCEVLAQTGRVTAACRAVGKHRDTIYAHRQSNPLFALAVESARADARHRLADGLLEDALDGSVEYFYRNGELVGERRYRDNRLALAVLRRLDKMAEARERPAETKRRKFDTNLALKALRSGAEEDFAAALELLDSDTSDSPPFDDDEGDEFKHFGTDRVWQEAGEWWTNFPPPPGFDGEEHGSWDDDDYMRECTADENDLLAAARQAQLADYRSTEETERDTFFAELAAELEEMRADDRHPGLDPGPASSTPEQADLTEVEGDPLLSPGERQGPGGAPAPDL